MWSVVAGKCPHASILQRRSIGRFVLPAATSGSSTMPPAGSVLDLDTSTRNFSGKKHKKFTPRRRPSKNFRPVKPRGDKYKFGGLTFGSGDEKDVLPLHGSKGPTQLEREGKNMPRRSREDYDEWEREYGPMAGPAMRYLREQQDNPPETAEDFLRDMDYLTAAEGSTEELAYERRALSNETPEEREAFMQSLDEMVERQTVDDLEEEWDDNFNGDAVEGDGVGLLGEDMDYDINDPMVSINPNQKAFGQWGEQLIRVDRNIKLWRGGRIQSYRALVIGGNLNGCGGFGTGKAPDPRSAVLAASRHCKRNIFFLDRYQQNALTRDLVGKANSCKVVLRATYTGLKGNPLCAEILKYFGVTNCTAKCVQGNRSQYNVVRATFKAICTHESMEDISYKRGRRLVSIDRGRRLQL